MHENASALHAALSRLSQAEQERDASDAAYCYAAWVAGSIPYPGVSEDDAVKWGIEAIERNKRSRQQTGQS